MLMVLRSLQLFSRELLFHASKVRSRFINTDIGQLGKHCKKHIVSLVVVITF